MPTTKQRDETGSVALRGAVLCVDCEFITDGKQDRCLVCGSRSLMNLSKLIGSGELSSAPSRPVSTPRDSASFDVSISIQLRQSLPREFSSALEGLITLIRPWLNRGCASCHIEVMPKAEESAPRGVDSKPADSTPKGDPAGTNVAA